MKPKCSVKLSVRSRFSRRTSFPRMYLITFGPVAIQTASPSIAILDMCSSTSGPGRIFSFPRIDYENTSKRTNEEQIHFFSIEKCPGPSQTRKNMYPRPFCCAFVRTSLDNEWNVVCYEPQSAERYEKTRFMFEFVGFLRCLSLPLPRRRR